MWPWTTKSGKCLEISFPLMNGFIGSDNISLKYNYLKIWNLSLQKKNITILRKSPLKFSKKVLSNAYYYSKITFWYIYSRKFTKLHATWSLFYILMILGSHTMYCWLLLKIYPCCLWLMWSRVTYISNIFTYSQKYHDGKLARLIKALSCFMHFTILSPSWFYRQSLKRRMSRGRYLHGLNKCSPGNSLPENSARVCWTLEKPIFGSMTDSVHLSAVSVRLYFKNKSGHTHAPWLRRPHSFGHQEWTVWKRSQCAELWPFQTWKEFPFFALYRKTEHTGEWADWVNERSSLSEVTKHWCQLSI